MKAYRFKHFRAFIPAIWADETLKNTDEWWQFQPGIDEFNELRRERLVTSVWWIIDECMSAWRPRKNALGGLPNISFVKRKPEDLGTYSGLLLFLLSCLY
jgi:hypothetical protein